MIKNNNKYYQSDFTQSVKNKNNIYGDTSKKTVDTSEENNSIKMTFEKTKTWYKKNKDGLKGTSKEIIEEDIEILKDLKNKIQDLYQDSDVKDKINSLKDVTKKQYEDDKNTIKELYKKLKD